MIGDVLSVIVFVTQLLLLLVGIVFFLSGADDAFFDISYLSWHIWKTFRRRDPEERISEDALRAAPEQPIAMMVPAWHESDVIRSTLSNMIRGIEYGNYHIFVGTYPNDEDTQREVDGVIAVFPNVHRIVCPNDGPTCKADCLNAIYDGICLFEKEHAIEFAVFQMEDSEDLVHPLALKLMNHLIPDLDFVQLPVFPLERKWYEFTCGHYIEEFCEYLGKDILVRGLLTHRIPAAGVGAGFSRRAMATMSACRDNEVFETSSLTEDYEFGLRVGSHNLRSRFVSQPISTRNVPAEKWTPHGKPDRRIAIREYFPSTFKAAVKQKSRWVLGIAIQGWKNLGWKGNLAVKYTLLRDRKGIVTNVVTLLGYLIVVVVLLLKAYAFFDPDAYRYPPLVQRGSFLWWILLMNAGFLVNRVVWRSYFAYQIYGIKQACLSVPRLVWGNLVNGCATSRSLYLYTNSFIRGTKIAWDKTAHVLPRHIVLNPVQGGSSRMR